LDRRGDESRAAGPEVTELELALRPELAAELANPRRVYEQFEKVQKELGELADLEPPEPAPSITEAGVGIVLGALHLAAVHTTRPPDEEPEQRGNAHGSPSWHEGVALWERVLAVVDPKDRSLSFEVAWSALVDAAGKYLDHYGRE
jgi:hypothetical protein